MKMWIIPMKGKGHEVTARNIALGEPMELARPLTTDEMDNVLMYEEQEAYADNGEGRQDEIRGGNTNWTHTTSRC